MDLPDFGRSESRAAIVAPEAIGELIPHILEAFGLRQRHAVGLDIGTPSLLYAAANHPGLFKSMIIGGGATDPTDIGDILEKLVHAPSLDPFKNMQRLCKERWTLCLGGSCGEYGRLVSEWIKGGYAKL